jgi:hypothetical protein
MYAMQLSRTLSDAELVRVSSVRLALTPCLNGSDFPSVHFDSESTVKWIRFSSVHFDSESTVKRIRFSSVNFDSEFTVKQI